MKKIFYFIGVGLVIGGIVVSTMYLLNSKKKDRDLNHDYKATDEERTAVDKVDLTEVSNVKDDLVYEEVKISAIGSMYSRHEDVAAIMSDSVEIILENVKLSDEINDEINAVSSELDKVLKEVK